MARVRAKPGNEHVYNIPVTILSVLRCKLMRSGTDSKHIDVLKVKAHVVFYPGLSNPQSRLERSRPLATLWLTS